MLLLKLFILLLLNVIIEFLPVSSTAHSVIIYKILNIDFNINFILALSQLGITLGVCCYFRNVIKEIIVNLFKFDLKYISFCLKVLITMIPTVLVGLCFYSLIKTYFQSNISISVSLLLGSLLMFFAEKYNSKLNKNITAKEELNIYDINYITALKIGFLQGFSLIPGISRSATTISACLLSKFSREKSIEMSFFISIPISFSASIYDLYKNINVVNNYSYLYYIYIFMLSFLFSIVFMKKIIDFLKNNTLYIFVYYRVIFSILLMLV